MKTILYPDRPAAVTMRDDQTCLMGIDPGAVSGAYAIRKPDGEMFVGDFAVVNGQLDAAAFSRLLSDQRVRLAVVENVGAMPKQGIASTFKFGIAVGIIRGVLMANGVPIHYVVPTVWKKHWGLLRTESKDASRALAILRHPKLEGLELKRHHGRADALLMLEWYREAVLREFKRAQAILWPASEVDPDDID